MLPWWGMKNTQDKVVMVIMMNQEYNLSLFQERDRYRKMKEDNLPKTRSLICGLTGVTERQVSDLRVWNDSSFLDLLKIC